MYPVLPGCPSSSLQPTNQPCHFPPPTTFYIQTPTLTTHFHTLTQSNKTMATLTLNFTVLFFFFTFSSARISLPLTLAENYVIDVSNSYPETNSKQTILLPSQKPESSNPATILPSQKPVSLNPATILSSLNLKLSDPTTILPGQKPKSSNPTIILRRQKPESSNPTTILQGRKPESSDPTTILPGQKPESSTIIPGQKPESSDPTTILPGKKLESSDPITIPAGQKPKSSDPTTILPSHKLESSDSATILPSQKLESSDPATILELELEPEITNPQTRTTTNNEPGGSNTDLPVLSDTISIETLQLNPSSYIRIRPINRHFRIKPSLFRIHRCRHHHNMNHVNKGHEVPYDRHHHNMNHVNKGHEVPYGDDMILAGQTIDLFEPSMLRGSVRSTPAKWGRIHHYQHDEDDSKMKRHPSRQYTFAEQKLKRKAEEKEKRKDQEERKEGVFIKKVRKFLNHI